MRIVHTFFRYPPAIGGHERYVQELAEGIHARGHDVRVVTSTLCRGDQLLDGPYSEVNGIPVTRLAPKLPLRRRMVLPRLRETLLAAKPDLIHAHDIWRDTFAVSIDVARELQIPIFLNPVYHDRTIERHAATWMRRLRRVAAKVPADARVFFNTPWEERLLAAAGIRFANTDLLPPSLDLDELEHIPEQPVPGIPADKLLVSFVGRLHPAKGIDLLIRAFACAVERLTTARDPTAERVHLVVAGFRDSPQDYAALAEECGVRERVTILIDRPRAEIVNLLRASAIFALPSRCESFGIVVIEAWATSNLVLVGDHWALPHVVRHEHDGIVCADDEWTDRLVQAIRDVDTSWGRQLVRNGARTLRREHLRHERIDRLMRHLEAAAS